MPTAITGLYRNSYTQLLNFTVLLIIASPTAARAAFESCDERGCEFQARRSDRIGDVALLSGGKLASFVMKWWLRGLTVTTYKIGQDVRLVDARKTTKYHVVLGRGK
jgi:hypothetical protein